MNIVFVCPTYKFEKTYGYTESAIASFFRTTTSEEAVVIVVNDGDDFDQKTKDAYQQRLDSLRVRSGQRVYVEYLPEEGNLSRGWNHGINKAKEVCDPGIVIAGNNDILFTTGWSVGIIHAIAGGMDLVGPASNAPGTTAGGAQAVTRLLKSYDLSDTAKDLDQTARELWQSYAATVVEVPVNGFCLIAPMTTWEKLSTTEEGVNPFDEVNLPMAGNEDEMQSRLREQGLRSAAVPSSFVFHYRSASRGSRYLRGPSGQGGMQDVYRLS